MAEIKYKRVLLKLSGEALARDAEGIYNHAFIDEIAKVIKKCVEAGVEVGVIVGADCTVPSDTPIEHLEWVREKANELSK